MDAFHFNHVTEYEYNVILLCTEILQRNLDCFDDANDQLLIKASIKQTISKLEKQTSLSPFEFFVVLHAIELCALTLRNMEKINKSDLCKIRPYKKIIFDLYQTYGTLLYMDELPPL